jgi:hypothetical protein
MGLFATDHEIACTVEVEHSNESLEAHVALDGNPDIGPGDRVCVHGEAIRVSFGEKISVRRAATWSRAGLLLRAWTKFAGHFGMAELYEVSFTGRGL